MLGLILGRSAGLTRAELMLPRFLLWPLVAGFKSNFLLPVAEMGEAVELTEGLLRAEGRGPEGVLRGPSFGVFRAGPIRGVESSSWTVVSDLVIIGRKG